MKDRVYQKRVRLQLVSLLVAVESSLRKREPADDKVLSVRLLAPVLSTVSQSWGGENDFHRG